MKRRGRGEFDKSEQSNERGGKKVQTAERNTKGIDTVINRKTSKTMHGINSLSTAYRTFLSELLRKRPRILMASTRRPLSDLISVIVNTVS